MPDELPELKGRAGQINADKRTIALEDKEGVIHPLTWTPELDVVMAKWKTGFYLKIHVDGEQIKKCVYWNEGKTEMPRKQGGGRPFQPRNEKLIVAQCLVKAYTDLYIASNPPDGVDFNTGRETILAAVEVDVDRMMKAGGA